MYTHNCCEFMVKRKEYKKRIVLYYMFKIDKKNLVGILIILAALNAFIFGLKSFADIPYYVFSIFVPIFFAIYLVKIGKKELVFGISAVIIALFWFLSLGLILPLEQINFVSILEYFWNAIQGFVMLGVGIYLMPKLD